jgi:hypothetical protein
MKHLAPMELAFQSRGGVMVLLTALISLTNLTVYVVSGSAASICRHCLYFTILKAASLLFVMTLFIQRDRIQ